MREWTIAGYTACLVLAVVLELLARRRPRRGREGAAAPAGPRRGSGLATLGGLLDELLLRRAPRLALIVFWWWLGWHFLVVRTVDPPLG